IPTPTKGAPIIALARRDDRCRPKASLRVTHRKSNGFLFGRRFFMAAVPFRIPGNTPTGLLESCRGISPLPRRIGRHEVAGGGRRRVRLLSLRQMASLL